MVLVDTSVWVEHLRYGKAELRELLEDGEVMCHLFVIGELACGSIRNRSEILDLLNSLPSAPVAEHMEALLFLNKHRLFRHGLGWIDIHLLAAASLAGTRLWTKDRALKTAAEHLGISY